MFIQDPNKNIGIIKGRKKRRVKIPVGDEDEGNFFPRNGEWSGNEGQRCEQGWGWGTCPSSSTHAVAIQPVALCSCDFE